METKKVLGIIFSLLFLGAFTFVLTWGIINFNKVKDSMSGTQIYDSEDLNNAYQDGYDTALKDKEEYTGLINSYRDTITTLNDNISQLNSQIATLQNNNKDYETQVNTLSTQKANLQTEIDNLNVNKSENEKNIDSLNTQITTLNTQITGLNLTISSNEETIKGLNTQISSLNTQKDSLNNTITTNEKTISDLRIEINNLNTQIVELSNDKTTNENSIKLLNNKVSSLNEQIESLNNQNSSYSQTITDLNSQISTLTTEKNNLLTENTSYYNTISSLNNQVLNLQTVNTQLENTNTLHQNTITSLNSQIASLNEQIKSASVKSQDNTTTINSLNAKITHLEESVSYYENYISTLEMGEQVVATFEYDGSVYNIQVVNKGSKVSVTTPTSTERLKFNYWTVNGEQVDLSTYTISANTRFVANTTKYSYVQEIVDGVVVDSGYFDNTISYLGYLDWSLKKDGYVFIGWHDGTKVHVMAWKTIRIEEDTTFTAVFAKLHTVTFMYEDETKSTQTIQNEKFATDVTIESTDYKIFNGWKVNGVIVDVATYSITEDTTFVADITYKYDVKFMVDDNTVDSQIVEKNNYPTLPTNPAKDGYSFEGWSVNGVDLINPATIQTTENTTYIAVFKKLYNVTFVYEDETISTQTIKENTYANSVSVTNTTYKQFNGWKVNDEIVDLSSYKITQDTQFIADITYKYDVKFVVDKAIYNSQIIVKNEKAILPNNPTKDEYEFDGWSLDGVTIVTNIEDIAVTENTTYTALFTKVYTVTFIYNNENISVQTIRNGEFATVPEIASDEHIVFNYWTLNSSSVEPSTYSIVAPTTFVANLTYKYDVVFMSEDAEFSRELVSSGETSTLTSTPTKDNYYFEGWTLDGENVIDITSYKITQNTTFIAKFAFIPYGLFDANGNVVYSWDALISNKYFTIAAGVLKQGTNSDRTELAGVIKIPDTITQIYSNCFEECGYLTGVVMTDSITQIGSSAFSKCYSLTDITISNNVTTLYGAVFANCDSLESIVIPSSVTKIYSQAFFSCNKLKYVYLPSSVVDVVASSPAFSPFYGCDENLTIYLGSSEIPSGYSQYWNSKSYHYVSSGVYENVTYYAVKTGYTLTQFYDEIGG